MSALPWPVGLVAILRGLPTHDAAEVGRVVAAAGFTVVEVPFGSPDPLGAVEILRATLPGDVLVGVGTVLGTAQVRAARAAGAQVVVSPCTDVDVVGETVRLGMLSCPGAATPTEAFAAVRAGAHAVKVFPCGQVGTGALQAWASVLPADLPLLPVGGVEPHALAGWVHAGATGFGIGSALYQPRRPLLDVAERAAGFADRWRAVLPHVRSRP